MPRMITAIGTVIARDPMGMIRPGSRRHDAAGERRQAGGKQGQDHQFFHHDLHLSIE